MSALPGKAYFQQRQRNRLYETVVHAIEDAADRTGIRKKDIAEKAGVSPPQLSRWLAGPANWTIDSISDVLYALGMELKFEPKSFSEIAKGNRSHDFNQLHNEDIKPSSTTTSLKVHVTFPSPITQSTASVVQSKVVSVQRD